MELTEAASWVLAVVFLAAAAEKLRLLATQTSRWQPIFVRLRRIRAHAAALVTAALVADLSVLVLLLIAPSAGAALALVLIAAYTAFGVPAMSSNGESCQCFLGFMDASTKGSLVVRNSLLAAISLVVALSAIHAPGLGSLPEAAILLAIVAGLTWLTGGRQAGTASERPSRAIDVIPRGTQSGAAQS